MSNPDDAGTGSGSSAHPDISATVVQLRAQATAAGIPQHLFDALTGGVEVSAQVLRLASAQPEHERTIGDYVTALVSDDRVASGRQLLTRHQHVLAEITSRFGVPAEILVAIWGIESNFGARTGNHPVVQSLLTLAAMPGRRQDFWRAQVIAAMAIVAAGDAPADQLVGSWAGAMGHTQFIPTTYRDHAVDFDGDGRRDIWTSPADALASAANYLRNAGWQADLPWGFEVGLASTFDFAAFGDDAPRPWADWQRAGVAGGSAPPGSPPPGADSPLRLKLPAGAAGPAFLVSENFQAILTYNAALAYALAVGQLAARIAGAPPQRTAWPDIPPLSRHERIELQQLLVDQGYDTGGVDGILGRASRQAIRSYQLRHGLRADGFHSLEVLDHLRCT